MPEKKRKFKKIFILLFFLLIIFIVFTFIYFAFGNKIRNIIIYDNVMLSDQEIIELASLKDYPNFYTTTSYSIKKKILASDNVKEVKVKKTLLMQVKIYIKEYAPIFIKLDTNTIVLENKKELEYKEENLNLPILINYVPDVKYDLLVNRYIRLDKKVTNKISEIKYEPNEYDEDRFLLYMNDENYVYITLTKLELLNKYNETVTKLEGKKGILYLDSGSYFEIKE